MKAKILPTREAKLDDYRAFATVNSALSDLLGVL
jgi:hypothetical protein